MGMLGRYIDGLTEEQKDKVIQAQEWRTGSMGVAQGPRCLMGHAKGIYEDVQGDPFYGIRLGVTFDSACRRFGQQRIVRACKLRASKPQFILPTAQQSSKLNPSHHFVSGD